MKPQKQQAYHLEPPEGLMNDPNGLVWFRGRYYVFFQWNRFKKDHSHKEWGLFTSENLIDWEFQGGALRPDEPYDQSGVHSGSAFVIDGKLCAFYTGSDKSGGCRKSSQCLAVSTNGADFQKKGVVLPTPSEFTEHFRDPKVFRAADGGWRMVIGAQQKNGKGAVALCRSADGLHWQYSDLLAAADHYEMVECPDLFLLSGQHILTYCLQRRDNAADQVISARSVYRAVTFDDVSGTIVEPDLETGYNALDCGFDFFAPQTFETPDGRRIVFAWMSRMTDEQERVFAEDEPRIHCLTLPRELGWHNGRLYQKPARELYQLLGDAIHPGDYPNGCCTIRTDTRAWHLQLRAENCPAGLRLDLDEASLFWDGAKLVLTRQNWAGAEETRVCPLMRLDQIELWSDQSSLEIFLNHGEAAMSARIFPRTGTPTISAHGVPDGSALTIHRILADNHIKMGGNSK